MRNPEVLVLGGGLAGLSASRRGGYPVYEAEAHTGGNSASFNSHGFVFDLGIHILQSKDPAFHNLMDEVGVVMNSHLRSAWIFSHGNYVRYPFQVNTWHLPLPLRISCVGSYLLGRGKGTPHNYHDWIIENFGTGFARHFLIPYARKFWRVDPREMTFEWVGDRVPRPRVSDLLKGAVRDTETGLGTNHRFQYPQMRGGGFGSIPEALRPPAASFFPNRRATEVALKEREIRFSNGDLARYDYLISTIPLPELIGMLRDVPAEISAAASRLTTNSIAVISLGFDCLLPGDRHWIHFPQEDISFFRMSFPFTFADGLVPNGCSSIQAEASYDPSDPPDPEQLVETVLRDLRRAGVLSGSEKVITSDVRFIRYGYVIYDFQREESLKTIHTFLEAHGIFPCGRYGSWKYLWSDEAIADGLKTADKVATLVAGMEREAHAGA